MNKLLLPLCGYLFSIFSTFCVGLGSVGHMVTAAETYHQLSPELKAQMFDLLKAHPDFAKWSRDYHPNANYDLPTYVFMRSSLWLDEIRRK